MDSFDFRAVLNRGVVIPAHPLALTSGRQLDERHQRALTRYYLAGGVGGLAVGVHTTQFAIRDPKYGLYEPVLALAAEEAKRCPRPVVRIAGLCGSTNQAITEARIAGDLGYHAGLLSLGAWREADESAILRHCREVADAIPVVGFYLQPSVGGRILSYSFWRQFAEIPNVVAIKIAPFNRYQTWDVVRAVIDADRTDVALYTGNDDAIVTDLVTPFTWQGRTRRIVGGLLGHWAVWTRPAVALLDRCHREPVTADLLRTGVEVTDANAAFFDAANQFQGCIAGLHEVLRRQGLLSGIWCLDHRETLGPGQLQEIDRVAQAYPHLNDDAFVATHRDDWLGG